VTLGILALPDVEAESAGCLQSDRTLPGAYYRQGIGFLASREAQLKEASR
jgi:hypothetical protein